LLEQLREIIIVIDQDQNIRHHSRSTEQILGYPAGALHGKNWLDYIAIDDHAVALKLLAQPNQHQRVDLRMIHRENFLLHMEGTMQSTDEPEGGVIIALTDATQLKARGIAIQRLTRDPNPTTDAMYQQLTPREKEIFLLVAEGYTSVEIANQLIISRRTVDSHRANIMDKLSLPHISAWVQFAIKQKLIALD